MKRMMLIMVIVAGVSASDMSKFLSNCNAGDPGGCDRIAFDYQEKKDYVNAVKYYTMGCDKDFVSSCFALACMYAYGVAMDKDLEKLRKACKGSNEEACQVLGIKQ